MTLPRNEFLDSALSVVKGAICLITHLPMGRSTKSVKFISPHQASLTVGPFTSPLSSVEMEEIQNAVNQKILEDCEFHVLLVPRDLAEAYYGDSFLDDFGIPSHLTELQLVLLEDWSINCNKFPVLRSTGLLNKIDLNAFQFKPQKSVIQVTFTVTKAHASLCLDFPLVASPKKILSVEELSSFSMHAKTPHSQTTETPSGNKEPATVYQHVTPWTVECEQEEGIDYDRLIQHFGCSKITQGLLDRIESLTKQKPHYFLQRGIFFSHRDLHQLLDSYEKKQPFYIYTGRGPSSEALHLGHLVPFMFTKYLQEVFNAPVVIHLSDDEKFLFKPNLTMDQVQSHAIENIKDILALGFDLDKTLIVMSSKSIDLCYSTVLEIQKKITYNQMRGIFGFQDSDNIGKLLYPTIQAALSFSTSFPNLFGENRRDVRCLIPQAIDQDPYFRMARDVAPRLGLLKPALIHSKFLSSLQGLKTKMSGSVDLSSIYCTDTPQQIKHKINKYAFSGGCATIEEHRTKGANLNTDVPYQYLTFFLEDNERLEEIRHNYKHGNLLSGQVKAILIETLTQLVTKHQKRRSEITIDLIHKFMDRDRECFKQFKQTT